MKLRRFQAGDKNLSIPLNQQGGALTNLLKKMPAWRLVVVVATLFTGLVACGDTGSKKADKGVDSVSKARSVADLVPAERSAVKKEPVATYSEKVKNPLNDWRFQVTLFETPKTFRYLMKLEYEEMRESDTLKIPNLGFEPKLKIVKGDEPYSCIIGFLDKQDKFREYKKVIASNNRLRVITLKHYAVYMK